MILNCNGKPLDLSTPKVMGVININEDSFYAGSRLLELNDIIGKAKKMIEDGAAIIDIGAMSSRPKAALIDQQKEWSILAPVLEKLLHLNVIISIDTVWSLTAKNAINIGCHIINDISSSNIDTAMIETVGAFKNVPYIMMHMVGTPEAMQDNIQYENMMVEMMAYFSKKIALAKNSGIKDIIIDPGFGFSKSLNQNYEVLKKLAHFQIFDLPILAGLSRKSMLYRPLQSSPEAALNATSVANTIALINGAKLLRVHDVKEAAETIAIFNQTYN